MIDQRRPAPVPGPGNGHTVIALHDLGPIFAGQWRAAGVANQPPDELGVAPTGAAKAVLCLCLGITGHALRGVDCTNDALQLHFCALDEEHD
jgi:hypothetical protein